MNVSVTNNDDYTYGNYGDSPMYFDYQDNNSIGTQNNSDDSYGNQDNWTESVEYTEFVYEAFDFERPIYLYLSQILVAITALVNVLVIWVLLKKNMRSVTNMILVVIAISDSMTGLVTLPTYTMLYLSQERGDQGRADYAYDYYECDGSSYADYTVMLTNTTTNYDDVEHRDAFFLSRSLWNAFMISKFFLSKSFHTTSIWLTVYLGVQRNISVAYPFNKDVSLTTRNTLIVCIAIAVSAPFLHLLHLIDERTVQGYCTWQLKEGCGGDCVHMWLTLVFRHLFPCANMTTTIVLFIRHFRKNLFNSVNASKSSRKHSTSSEAKDDDKTRRATMIVIAVVIGLLIPEMPYGIYLFYTSILRHTNMTRLNDLKPNRAIHAGYEIVLVLTFHLNFYIFTFLNARFREQLLTMCSFSRIGLFSLTTGPSYTSAPTTVGVSGTKSESMSNTLDSKGMEMKPFNHSSDDQTNGKLP